MKNRIKYLILIALLSVSLSGCASGPKIVPFEHAKQNAVVVYKEDTEQPMMVAVNVSDLNDPSWNPPGTKQFFIPIKTYNTFKSATDVGNYLDKTFPLKCHDKTP